MSAMTSEELAAIRKRSEVSSQAYRSGTVGTTPMDVDGLSVHDALDLVAESAHDVPALLAEVDRLRAGIEAELRVHRGMERSFGGPSRPADVLEALLNPTEGETDGR